MALKTFMALMGLGDMGASMGAPGGAPPSAAATPTPVPTSAAPKAAPAAPPAAEELYVSLSLCAVSSKKKHRSLAMQLKTEGNKLYKDRDFEGVRVHFSFLASSLTPLVCIGARLWRSIPKPLTRTQLTCPFIPTGQLCTLK
jgi:hypothetical protein